ncbi:ATP-grasp domain-containing protein [Candidatus Daviesbacteria bacterium]|nr:ATP-grasp domain-containing protein [Candidatus Daviesbacteria bacterium]
MGKVPLISSILLELSKKLQINLLIEPEYGYVGRIKTKDGKVFYYCNSRLDINRLGASEIAKDKAYASYFMNQLGYPVPEGESFYPDRWCQIIKSNKNISAAVKYAEKLGYPVIVKPNSGSQGRGVEKVYNKDGLLKALAFAFNEVKDNVALVQKFIDGDDYRIVVVDDAVLCVYRRKPLSVIGNGKDTVNGLLNEKQQMFAARGRDTVINLADPRLERRFKNTNINFDTVLAKGKVLPLLDNANLSAGGEAEDVTLLLHEDYKKMAIKLSQDMGLKFSGIDIKTLDPISESIKQYIIIEINSAPGLDYYAEMGNRQKRIVKKLYKKVLLYMIKGYSNL